MIDVSVTIRVNANSVPLEFADTIHNALWNHLYPDDLIVSVNVDGWYPLEQVIRGEDHEEVPLSAD